jgi:CubicO group peptidase (beta-lactamase class C family)
MNSTFLKILILSILVSCAKNESVIEPETDSYFPPLSSNIWEKTSVEELGWNQNQVQPLIQFLEDSNTKAFILLHNGKIVFENYFNGHTADSPWYWASAGKTLTSIMVGIAEENGYLTINTKVSDYLGNGWTSSPIVKENLITPKHLLSMTSGLDDSFGDNVAADNLYYFSDAGSRWAYHNVYVKLQSIIEVTTQQSFSNYFNANLKSKIGMTGTWVQTGDFSVYYSTARSMARFGLLALNKGTWNTIPIVNETYFNNSISTSQTINKSYGYLWWFNGKQSYHLPQTQFEFQGELIPNAPSDLFCALGKNDQKIYVVPSKKLVIIRMGESAEESNFALSNFDNNLWEKINLIIN